MNGELLENYARNWLVETTPRDVKMIVAIQEQKNAMLLLPSASVKGLKPAK
jgi:hypothetical protein|tara:strand:+ start:509 stop:661 length:153 start_codon:yes stop_codon:yes gene_type:complete